MFPKISLTLFLLIVSLLALVPDVQATSHVTAGGISRRDHSVLKRFVKKRSPATTDDKDSSDSNNGGILGGLGPLIGAGETPDNTTDTSTSQTSTSSTTTESSATVSNSTSNTSTETSTSASTTNTTASSTSTSQTSSDTASQTSQTSQTTPLPENSQTVVTHTETATRTSSDAANPTGQNQSTGGLSSSGKTTLVTVLIVVGASVGAVAIIWTVFRKWKLSSSKKFDQRLNPIDWQPTADDDFAPHRRPGSDSASIHSDSQASRYAPTSNLSQGLDHDFTAGASHLAPVGGYADLARGPSPQPYMQENLSRGPSLTRPNYDNSVPLHHQNNYGAQY